MNDMRKLMKIAESLSEGPSCSHCSGAEPDCEWCQGTGDDYDDLVPDWMKDDEEELEEGPLRRDDPEMMDYDMDQEEVAADTADAPYYVEWNAQSWEWYGDGDPADGKGRYKPKGDGGRIVAINVPTYAQAQQIADKLDSDYENGDFEDSNVYGKQGMSGYVLDYHGANIRSMSKMDEFDREQLERYTHPNHMPKDYSKE